MIPIAKDARRVRPSFSRKMQSPAQLLDVRITANGSQSPYGFTTPVAETALTKQLAQAPLAVQTTASMKVVRRGNMTQIAEVV